MVHRIANWLLQIRPQSAAQAIQHLPLAVVLLRALNVSCLNCCTLDNRPRRHHLRVLQLWDNDGDMDIYIYT